MAALDPAMVLPVLLAGGVSLGVAALIVRLAPGLGLLVHPRPDRWSRRSVAGFGGIAVAAGWAVTWPWWPEGRGTAVGLLWGAGVALFMGLADDRFRLPPVAKVLGLVGAAIAFHLHGVGVDLSAVPGASLPATIVWVVAVGTAFNLLDHMDGIAAGTGLIAATVIAFLPTHHGVDTVPVAALALAAAAAGFLCLNFPPARLFLGDTGSLFLGTAVAGLSVSGTWRHGAGVLSAIAVPVLIVAVPLLDAAFVAVTRRQRGAPLTHGGTDHTAHRLALRGLAERRVFLVLSGTSALFGGLALVILRCDAWLVALYVTLGVVAIVAGLLSRRSMT